MADYHQSVSMDPDSENKQDIDPSERENQGAMHNWDYRLWNTRWDEHGCLEIRARLTPEQGALVIKAMDAAVKSVADSEPSADSDSHSLENTPAGASARWVTAVQPAGRFNH